MNEEPLQYEKWVEEALRGVIRRALTVAEKSGLPGDHHYYITFKTAAPGVAVPRRVLAQQGPEMTIVLQHQFSGLFVGGDDFKVTLSFGGRPERLCIPFAAITAFADPSVNFGLQLETAAAQLDSGGEKEGGEEGAAEIPVVDGDAAREAAPGGKEDGEEKSGQVIALDAFRKK